MTFEKGNKLPQLRQIIIIILAVLAGIFGHELFTSSNDNISVSEGSNFLL